MRRFIVGVMGSGENADENTIANAYELGKLIAQEGWVVLSGGRDIGVMAAVNQGAKQVPVSLTLGILSLVDANPSQTIDIIRALRLRRKGHKILSIISLGGNLDTDINSRSR